jgi:outer membrane biosynthesis protein TonB
MEKKPSAAAPPSSPVEEVPPTKSPEVKPEEPKPEPKPEKKIEKPPEAVKEATKKKQEVSKQAEKKVEKKPDKKEKPKKKQAKTGDSSKKDKKDDDLDSLMRDLESKAAAKNDPAADPQGSDRGSFDASAPMSASLMDAIRSQIYRCWRVPAGAQDIGRMRIELAVSLDLDGTIRRVQKVRYEDAGQAVGYQIFEESVLRALEECSPLQSLPTNRYGEWKSFHFIFDPGLMIQ